MKTTEITDQITAVSIGIRHGSHSEVSRGLAVPVFLRADGFGALFGYADGTLEITMSEDDVRTLISMFDDLVLAGEMDLIGVHQGSPVGYPTTRPAWTQFALRRKLIKRLLEEHDERTAAAAASIKETPPNATPPAIPR